MTTNPPPEKQVVTQSEARPFKWTDPVSVWNSLCEAVKKLSPVVFFPGKTAKAKLEEMQLDNEEKRVDIASSIAKVEHDNKKVEIEIEKDKAQLRILKAKARADEAAARLIENLEKKIRDRIKDREVAWKELKSVVQKIRLNSGQVEFDIPQIGEGEAEPDDKEEIPWGK